MARQKIDKEFRKNILKARRWIEDIAKKDANEAETRTRVHDIFGMLMGYDRYKHITHEHEIPGAGETVRCDLAIQIDEKSSKPDFLVEVKKVNIDLVRRHIGQAASYAINIGCEWVLLTNGREWQLHHVSFDQPPPQTKLVESWNIINDEPVVLATKFSKVCYKTVRRGGLKQLWEESNVLTPQNMLKAIFSPSSISLIRRTLKRTTHVSISPEAIVGEIRRLLNESALTEMENVKISLPFKKQPKKEYVPKIQEEEKSKAPLTDKGEETSGTKY